MSKGSGVWSVYGVVSYGVQGDCAQPKKPGVYTRVADYLEWIQRSTNGTFCLAELQFIAQTNVCVCVRQKCCSQLNTYTGLQMYQKRYIDNRENPVSNPLAAVSKLEEFRILRVASVHSAVNVYPAIGSAGYVNE